MRHRAAGVLATAAACGLVAVSLFAETAPRIVPAGAAPAVGAGRRGEVRYYLAIGASEAAGFQPARGHRHGEPTDEGYANDLVEVEENRWPGLRLEDFGCAGITAPEALEGGGPCRYPSGSEIATAVGFLRAHRSSTVLATVDLGFNDMLPCLTHRRADDVCAGGALAGIRRSLRRILRELRASGGPRLVVVGLEHDDPFLADMLEGDRRFAGESETMIEHMNWVLSSIYRAADDRVADVPRTMGTGIASARAASHVCALTWMCRDESVHPDDRGYRDIADAIATAISTPLTTSPGKHPAPVRGHAPPSSAGWPEPYPAGSGAIANG